MLSVRPKVAELAFQVYGRSLHPELFEVYTSRLVERGGFAAKIDITSAGHVVTWRYGPTVTIGIYAIARKRPPEASTAPTSPGVFV